MSEPLARAVLRAYVRSIIGIATALFVCAIAAMTIVVVRRDDRTARALARTLGSELHNHRHETLDELDALVRHELDEQQWFRRRTAVWKGGRELGERNGTLGAWTDRKGCESAWLDGWYRVCTVQPSSDTVIVIASPGAPLLFVQRPYVVVLLGIAIAVVVLLTIAAMLVWLERRLLGLWQDRYGPNRVGPFGLLQTVADAIKLLTKQDWIPPFADTPVFVLAPAVIMAWIWFCWSVTPPLA